MILGIPLWFTSHLENPLKMLSVLLLWRIFDKWMGTKPRPAQMTSLEVHHMGLGFPLTNCSKDGHKKASSPWGMYSLVPSLFKVHSTSLIILIVWKEQNLVHSVRLCYCRTVPWLWTVTNQMNISDCWCCLIFAQWSVTILSPQWLLLLTDQVQYPLVPLLWTNFCQWSPDTKRWFDVMSSTGEYSCKNWERETKQKDGCSR